MKVLDTNRVAWSVAYDPSSWSTEGTSVQVGDIISFAGVYERRTFWQWITRKPRKLKIYLVAEVVQ